MKDYVKVYDSGEIARHTRKRKNEQKLGEKICIATPDWQNYLKNCDARFIIVGIAEDIGVRANYGRPGAASAFKPAIDSFLNQQVNVFLPENLICVLGEIKVDDLMEQSFVYSAKDADHLVNLREIVKRLDERVALVIKSIVGAGKTPIIIGGGHNNAYGNIHGSFMGLQQKVNVINCDPHMDFRPLEGRHSGNGFSYAFEDGYLERYAVFGVHEQYNSSATLQKFREHPENLFFNTYENIFVREEKSFGEALKECISFVREKPCGIEIDLDSITNVPSSAKTSSGISALQARQFIHKCATHLHPLYLHVAEGAPVLSHIKADNKTGKLIAYLVTDFIKACSNTDR